MGEEHATQKRVAAGAAVVAATVLGMPDTAHATGNGQVSCSQSTNGRKVTFHCSASGTNAVKLHGWGGNTSAAVVTPTAYRDCRQCTVGRSPSSCPLGHGPGHR